MTAHYKHSSCLYRVFRQPHMQFYWWSFHSHTHFIFIIRVLTISNYYYWQQSY